MSEDKPHWIVQLLKHTPIVLLLLGLLFILISAFGTIKVSSFNGSLTGIYRVSVGIVGLGLLIVGALLVVKKRARVNRPHRSRIVSSGSVHLLTEQKLTR